MARPTREESVESVLARTIARVSYDEIPDRAVESVERAFVDTVGVALAGAVEGAGSRAVRYAAGDRSTLLSDSRPPAEAALVLGTAAHGLDYDDLSWGIVGHPSVVLVPPLLALADRTGLSGPAAVEAYVAGFETMCEIAAPVLPEHYEAGWHATATFGVFGAAAASAKALSLSTDETRAALSIAASTASGLKRNFGTMTKPLHAGLASRSGVTAALLAAEGTTADAEAIGGTGGFWSVYGSAVESPSPAAPPESGWWLLERGIDVKLYPCCYFLQTSVQAALDVAGRADIDPTTVEEVTVTLSPGADETLRHRSPETGTEAKFSAEYAVARALTDRRITAESFGDEAVSDPAVRRLAERVERRVDSDLDYDAHEATLRVSFDGRTETERCATPPGTFADPPTRATMRRKFDACAGGVLDEPAAGDVFDSLWTLGSVGSLADAVEPLRSVESPPR